MEQLSYNPLVVAIVSLLLSTLIGIIGYLFKKLLDGNKQASNNSIVQNFNTNVDYSEVEKIVENVVNKKMSDKNNNKS